MDEDDPGKQNKQQQANKQVPKKLPSSINIDVVTSSNSSGNSSLGAISWDYNIFCVLERGLKMIHKISGAVPPPSGKTQPKQIKVSIQSPPNMPVTNPNQSTASNVPAACNNKPSQQPAVEKENREVRISVLSTEPTRSGIHEPDVNSAGRFGQDNRTVRRFLDKANTNSGYSNSSFLGQSNTNIDTFSTWRSKSWNFKS